MIRLQPELSPKVLEPLPGCSGKQFKSSQVNKACKKICCLISKIFFFNGVSKNVKTIRIKLDKHAFPIWRSDISNEGLLISHDAVWKQPQQSCWMEPRKKPLKPPHAASSKKTVCDIFMTILCASGHDQIGSPPCEGIRLKQSLS